MRTLYCGWDGGGTRTTVLLTDRNGKALGQAQFGPLNLNGNSKATVSGTVRDAVSFMLEHGRVTALVIGMAGISNRAAVDFITHAVRAAGYGGPLRIVGDQEIALEGALEGPGAVLISGTGSVCCGRNEAGEFFRSGGYGWIIDDLGSGYAIGHDILTAAVRDEDGRGGPTCLKQMALEAVGAKDIPGLITWLYGPSGSKKEIAALATLLRPALAQSDAAALRIAEKASADLADMVTALWHRAGLTKGELVFSGSIPEHYPEIAEGVTERLRQTLPELRVTEPHGTAAQGAARLAVAAVSPEEAVCVNALPGFTMRAMREKDLPAVRSLLKRTYDMGDVPWSPITEDWLRRAALAPDRVSLVTEQQNGTLAGFALCATEPARQTAYLSMLAVAMPVRRRGVGAMMLRAIRELA